MSCRLAPKDAYKGYTLDLDKTIPPEETVRRFKERLKTIDLDILESTVRIDNGRLNIPVYFSICGSDAQQVIGAGKQMGKGGTPHQAEASAVMELAERFSLFSFSREPSNFLVEEYKNIKDRAVPFEVIAQSVHDESADLDAVTEIFSELPLRWTRCCNVTNDRELLIPFDWFFAINQFNGSSAGNCMEETMLQGICEVVERHVSSLISRNRLEVPLIDLASVTDPLALELLTKYRRQGIRLYASDFTLETKIPTIAILAFDPSTFPKKSEIVWTAGTTPHPQKSLIRALTEVAQLAGDFNTGSCYEPSGLPKFGDLSETDFIRDSDKKTGISNLPDLSNENIRIELENCLETLSRSGMDVFAVDVTHPELGIPSVYTIIPGAHFRERATGVSVGMFAAKLTAETIDPDRAVQRLLKMDRLLPDKYYVKFFLGTSCMSLNDPSTALKYLREALKLEPKDQDIPSIYSYMGVCMKDLERYREAIETLEKAEKYDSRRTDIHNLKGFCYFKLKEHEKAIRCFRKVLQLNPSSAIDYANIASNYRDMGDSKKAVTYYRRALELDPTIEFARENLIKLEK